MKNVNRLIGAISGCVVLISASCALAQDWPQWRGPKRDGTVTEFTIPQQWPSELTQHWTTTVGAGDATPALVGDKLYVFARQGEDEVTVCLDASDGNELWRDSYTAQAVTGAAARHPGPRSSPAVSGGRVVTLGVGGVLLCLDAATGAVVWREDPFPGVVPQFFTAMSPVIVDGLAVAHLGGKGNGALIAYDLATGQEKWRWAEEGPEYASPVLLTVEGTKQIVTLTEKSIVGVAVADGELLWRLPFVPEGRAYNSATPIIDGQMVIYTGSGRGTKAVKIEKEGEGFTATELWSNSEVAAQFNTPVLRDGLLFGLSDRGNLFCIEAQTGETAWIDTTPRGSGGFAAILSAGPVVLALPSDSELMAFAPSDSECVEVARVKIADTPTYAHPVIAGTRVFIKDEDAVTMWTLE